MHVLSIANSWFLWSFLTWGAGNVGSCNACQECDIGTNKAIIILPTSKANHTHAAQHITLPPNALHVQLKHYHSIHSSTLKGLANFLLDSVIILF